MKDKKRNILICVLLVIIAILYTLVVKFVDVEAIGPNNSSVGLATINQFFVNTFGTNDICYKISKYFGLLPIVVTLGFCLLAFLQFLKRKNLFKLDKEYYIYFIFNVIFALVYFFFEVVIINYRPVLEDGVLEASFPSSHTMMAIWLCGSAIIMSNRLLKLKKKYRRIFNIGLDVLAAVIVICRLFSGVHWFSDILGGIIIGSTLLILFNTTVNLFTEKGTTK